MEPRQQSPEQLPSPVQSPEALPEVGTNNTEVISGIRNEATERRLGHSVEAASQLPAQPPVGALPTPVITAQPQDDTTDNDSTQTPLAAADEDLIEKEWVDKAKKVIASTKDDPYRREEEIKRLQIEYIRKRYGREIGDDNAVSQGF